MQIEVVVTEWEQACCGVPFRVGDRITWMILAADPHLTPPGNPTRFNEEHHDQTLPDIPHWDVTGVVTTITSVRYPRVAVAGQARTFLWDTTQPDTRALNAVSKSEGTDADQYVVSFAVADDANLPAYVPTADSKVQSEREALLSSLNWTRTQDVVGEALEALADDAQHRYTDAARVIRTEGRSAVTIEPHREGATVVHWSRSDVADADGISVHVGDGDWHFEATVTHAEVVGVFLAAAASGRVEEHVEFRNSAPHALRTDVHSLDGQTWTTTDIIGAYNADNGVLLVAGYFGTRIQRGDHVYPPWISRTSP